MKKEADWRLDWLSLSLLIMVSEVEVVNAGAGVGGEVGVEVGFGVVDCSLETEPRATGRTA